MKGQGHGKIRGRHKASLCRAGIRAPAPVSEPWLVLPPCPTPPHPTPPRPRAKQHSHPGCTQAPETLLPWGSILTAAPTRTLRRVEKSWHRKPREPAGPGRRSLPAVGGSKGWRGEDSHQPRPHVRVCPRVCACSHCPQRLLCWVRTVPTAQLRKCSVRNVQELALGHRPGTAELGFKTKSDQ